MQDANKNRLYVHEVFVASNIKKGNTLQTAAFQPHGGIALYRDILANVLDISSACEGKQTSEKNKTSFADEMLADTLSNAPEELKGRITVRESSTGDEQEENFVQSYDIDGKPSGISRIELFDAKSNEDSTRFVIDGSDVDAASSEQDKWESLAREYHKTHPDVKLYIGDESGIGFSTFKDAYEFRNWTETRQQETSGTSEAKQEAKSENEKSHKAEGRPSAVSQVSNKALGIKDPAQQLAFEAVSQMLSDAGIPVEQVSNETMRQMAEGAEKKGEMLDTVLPEDESSFKGTVMSSTSGTKVLNNLDNAITRYEENPNNKPTNFLGDAAAALGATKHGSNSQYATFETKNGEVVTIRLSNHNAKVSNFDNHEEDKGISIVISRKPNARITNDGKSSVTEFFYSDKQLSKSEGKPLADILKSIKQALYSGEYKDTTGLAQVEEVNAENIPEFMTVYHGSGAKFDNRKFPTYIDQVPLFNVVFPRSAYRILGYGRIDGKFVKYLEQPYIDFGTATPLTVDERVQYMHDLGFEPINEEKTVFSDGEIVVSDLQKSNIVRDAAGNVRVIDADVKLHTKDIGGSYTYPPVEADTNINDDPQYQHIRY